MKESAIPADIRQSGVSEDMSILYPGLPADLKANAAFLPGAHMEELVWSAIRDVDRQTSRARRTNGHAKFLGQLEKSIDHVLLEGINNNVLLHAGVVATATGAVLLPASSGSGKSTLVSALCLAGYGYFSDEFAILNIQTGTFHPFPKSICLKEGGWCVLTAINKIFARTVTVTRTTGETVRFFAPDAVAPPGADATIRAIIIPTREPASRVVLAPVTRIDALTALLEQSLNLPLHGARGMDRIAASVERAECFELTYDRLEEAVDAISAIVPRGAVQSAASSTRRLS